MIMTLFILYDEQDSNYLLWFLQTYGIVYNFVEMVTIDGVIEYIYFVYSELPSLKYDLSESAKISMLVI